MATKIQAKPLVIKGDGVTQEEMAKILQLSEEDVKRLEALVQSLPGLHDPSEVIVKRREAKTLAAGR